MSGVQTAWWHQMLHAAMLMETSSEHARLEGLQEKTIFTHLCTPCPLHQCNRTLIDTINVEWIHSRTRAVSSWCSLMAFWLFLTGTYVHACKVASVVSSSVTLWTIAHQAPLPMGFSRQEYWSGLPCPPPGDLANPGIEPEYLTSLALAGRFFTTFGKS